MVDDNLNGILPSQLNGILPSQDLAAGLALKAGLRARDGAPRPLSESVPSDALSYLGVTCVCRPIFLLYNWSTIDYQSSLYWSFGVFKM